MMPNSDPSDTPYTHKRYLCSLGLLFQLGLFELADSELCLRLVRLREKLGADAAFSFYNDYPF